MKIYTVDKDPKNYLRNKNIDINFFRDKRDISKLIGKMRYILKKNNGVGLAAPQIGKNINLFIISLFRFDEVYINPKIIKFDLDIISREGCLSIPGVSVDIFRSNKVRIDYIDERGIPKSLYHEGMISKIIQHEFDHLQGKLMTDYAKM